MTREPLRPADYDSFPEFNFEEEPAGTMVGRLMPPLLGLMLLPFMALRIYHVATR